MEFTGERLMPKVSSGHYEQHLKMYEQSIAVMPERGLILDIACGSGWGTELVAKKAQFVIGMDISAEAVEYAAQNYPQPNIKHLVGSILDIPFPANTFAHVNSIETFEHVPHETIESLILECYRVLEPGGKFTFSTPDGAVFPYQPKNKSEYVGYHCWHYTREELYDLLRIFHKVDIKEPWEANFWVECTKKS